MASAQQVTAFVRQAISALSIEPPTDVLADLRGEVLHSTARVMLLDAHLRRIVRSLSQAEVPVIVLKGPALAATVYPRSDLRTYRDIDLTVREPDEAAVVGVLKELGFQEYAYDAEEARLAHAGHAHDEGAFHRVFLTADQEAQIELHLDPLQLGLRPTCEAERWDRSVPMPGLAGASMLSREDQVVQLSVHAHKHGFNRLIWLKDIDLLLRMWGEALDWSLVSSIARKEGVRSSVWYTLHLSRLILGTPVSPALLALFKPGRFLRVLYSYVWSPERIANLNGHMRRRAVQFHAAESWKGMIPSLLLMGRRGDRLRAIFQHLLRR
jgi:hypothetical protein